MVCGKLKGSAWRRPSDDPRGGREGALAGTVEPAGLALHHAGPHEGLRTRQETDGGPLDGELLPEQRVQA